MPRLNSPNSGNRLLDAVPKRDRLRLLEDCEQIEFASDKVLCERGDIIRHAYFPVGGFISLFSSVEGHAGMEVSLVGNEGMLGVSLVLGVAVAPLHAVVQGAGSVLRIGVAPFQERLDAAPALRRVLQRYIHVLLAQFAQTAACTRFHALDARLARWLLTTQDRAHSSEFYLTHEILARMLGVRRVGVTNAAGSLQKRGFLSYARGEIKILDRNGLRKVSCGCYRTAAETYENALG